MSKQKNLLSPWFLLFPYLPFLPIKLSQFHFQNISKSFVHLYCHWKVQSTFIFKLNFYNSLWADLVSTLVLLLIHLPTTAHMILTERSSCHFLLKPLHSYHFTQNEIQTPLCDLHDPDCASSLCIALPLHCSSSPHTFQIYLCFWSSPK